MPTSLSSLVVLPLIVLVAALAWRAIPTRSQVGEKIFTPNELQEYDGRGGQPIYLAIIGDVFDVSSGEHFYARGQSYSHFAGCDASRAFASGESSGAGLTDDLSGLELEDLESIAQWHRFFINHHTYRKVGRVAGTFYLPNGEALAYFPWDRISTHRQHKEEIKKQYPGCNMRSAMGQGTTVWCTLKSGGIERTWVGVPRKLLTTGERSRCVCVPLSRASSPELAHYQGCDSRAESCTATSDDEI